MAAGSALTNTIRNGTECDIKKELVLKWQSGARARRADRDGAKVYWTLYHTRVIMRMFFNWRLCASVEAASSDCKERVHTVAKEMDETISALTVQKDGALAEMCGLRAELEVEKRKRVDILLKIKHLFQNKFEDLSSEVLGVIDVPDPVGLPVVNYVPPDGENSPPIVATGLKARHPLTVLGSRKLLNK